MEPGDVPGLEYGGVPNMHGEAAIESGQVPADAQQSGVTPTAPEGVGASSGSPTVLCGELYRQGKLDWQTYLADSEYGRTLPPEVMEGYSFWAIPLSYRMARSTLLSSIVEPFVRSWAYECAYRMGKRKRGTVIGKIMAFFGEPVCGLIGKGLSYASYNKQRLHVSSR